MANKLLKTALFFICGLIAAFAFVELRTILSGPSITLEQTQEYARELSGDPQHPPVIFFYTTWCPACKVTREFMDEKKIPYIAAEIEQNLAAQYYFNQMTDGKGSPIPVTVIGDTVVIGYKPWTILEAYNSLQQKSESVKQNS